MDPPWVTTTSSNKENVWYTTTCASTLDGQVREFPVHPSLQGKEGVGPSVSTWGNSVYRPRPSTGVNRSETLAYTHIYNPHTHVCGW